MWEAVEPTRQVPVLGYRLEFSIDGGRSWELALECHGAAEAVAALCALQLHQTYLFRVAAVGVAGVGPCSPASLPFDPGTPAPPDADFSEISSEIASAQRVSGNCC